MEDVLYDLYIAETEIKQNQSVFRQDSLLKIELLQSVFNKHEITEQKFDTSLVWYNANLEAYMKINERIMDRYNVKIEKLKGELEKAKKQLTVIDSTYVYSSELFILSSVYRENIYPFEVKDSVLLTKDNRYYINFLAVGIKGSDYPVLTFNIESKDTTFVFRDTIKNNFRHTFIHSTPRHYPVRAVYGSFYLPEAITSPVVIANFAITQQNTITLPKDSLNTIINK